MSFPATTARYVIFLLNLVFLVSALAVAAVAVVIDASFWNKNLFLEQDWASPAVIIAIICIIISVISLFGCCGVVKESRFCLILFSCLLVVFILAEIVAGIYLYTDQGQIASKLNSKMKESMQKYNMSDPNYPVTRAWDAVEYDLHCCGFNNSTDWAPILGNGILPRGCCKDLPVQGSCTPRTPGVYERGCFAVFGQELQSKWLLVAGIAIGVGVVQMLCAVAAGFLARHINKQYEAV